MLISRFNADFGNSSNKFIVDGYYFEIPTSLVEISREKAETHFVDAITDPRDLLKRMLISIRHNNEEKFFLVGDEAEKQDLSNLHVTGMHDKIRSNIPYISFLAAASYFHALNMQNDDNTLQIEKMNMMLPIWLLKREAKFSIAQKLMEDRFVAEHIVTIHTPGMQRELKVHVKNAKCRIESEIARHAIKYKMKISEKNPSLIIIEKRKEATMFEHHRVIGIDIGGGSTDAVELTENLKSPKNRNSFKVIDIKPFLGHLEELRKDKLLDQFQNIKQLEKFIVKNYKDHVYLLQNENIGASIDLTDILRHALREYASSLVSKVLTTFIPESNDIVYKFIYFGGEAPILEFFIKEALEEHLSQQAARNNHFFLQDIFKEDVKEVLAPSPRTINLCALELRSIDETETIAG